MFGSARVLMAVVLGPLHIMAYTVSLEDSVPFSSSIEAAGSFPLNFTLGESVVDVSIILQGRSGNPDLYVSTVATPNTTVYEWRSIDADGDVVAIYQNDARLLSCRERAVCVLQVAVIGQAGSPFTITASTIAVGTGFVSCPLSI